MRISAILSAMLIASAGCASIPEADERSAALNAEPIAATYRIAVTSVMKKPDVVSMIGAAAPLSGLGLVFNSRAAIAEGSAGGLVAKTPLERIDDAMMAAVSEGLGATPEYLDRASFGGDELAPTISNIAFDAFQAAKSKDYDAMLFVHLQPTLLSATGGGKRRLSLKGTPVFKSARNDALLYFEDFTVECAGMAPIADEALAAEIDKCADDVIARMSAGVRAAFAARGAAAG